MASKNVFMHFRVVGVCRRRVSRLALSGSPGRDVAACLRAFSRSSDDPVLPLWAIGTVSVPDLNGGVAKSRRTARQDGVRRDSSHGTGTAPVSSVWGKTYNV